ncbi:MAG: hypothetical protein CVU89_05195 [Firmicutes bacterium HGW-Firmicutes-14]|nr:MAG: hypothetical protein CVU89_05195 [Firmicutes bacterium HGW-Firmicutes-14]
MKLIIDGKAIKHDFSGELKLQDVVQSVSREIASNRRIITNFEINGAPLEGSDSQLADLTVAETGEFTIFTNLLETIITDSLSGLTKYLPQLVAGIEECAAMLQAGKRTEAMDMLQQCVTGLGWFTEIIDKSGQLITSAISPSLVEDLALLEKRQDINKVLNQVVENLTNEELLAVSDLLEYELAPLLSEWNMLIPQVIEKIEQGLN